MSVSKLEDRKSEVKRSTSKKKSAGKWNASQIVIEIIASKWTSY